jgi:hypothetical protein
MRTGRLLASSSCEEAYEPREGHGRSNDENRKIEQLEG